MRGMRERPGSGSSPARPRSEQWAVRSARTVMKAAAMTGPQVSRTRHHSEVAAGMATRSRPHTIRGGCRGAHPQPRSLNSGAAAVSIRVARATEGILIMNMSARADIDEATRTALAELALGNPELLGEGLEMRAQMQRQSGLDPRTFALVKVAALIALDAPPASYLWQVGNALDDGATPEDLIGVLRAVAPQVGGPKTVAAAPELMVALGLALPEGV